MLHNVQRTKSKLFREYTLANASYVWMFDVNKIQQEIIKYC